jgi:predicted metal-dependent hydrolase
VTVPRWGSKREGRAFADSQRAWVDKQLARVAQQRAEPREEMPADLERELRARATRELPPRLLELAARHGLSVARVSVRNQRWRWGSCSPNGHICLNWRLVLMPDWIRDYVMIHELMHLKRMDHSPRFWKLVGLACPDYQAARRFLRQHQANENRSGLPPPNCQPGHSAHRLGQLAPHDPPDVHPERRIASRAGDLDRDDRAAALPEQGVHHLQRQRLPSSCRF